MSWLSWFRWDTAWQKSVKQNDQLSQAYGAQSGSPFNFQFQLPVTRQRRSNSLTPPVASSHQPEVIERSGNSNLPARHKARSYSVSGDHSSEFDEFFFGFSFFDSLARRIIWCFSLYTAALIGLGPLSPQSSCASSGSEGRLDEASARPLSTGMRGQWLNSFVTAILDLHLTTKYEKMKVILGSQDGVE